MKPLLLIWQMLRLPGLLVLLAFSGMFLVLSNGGGPSRSDIINALVLTAVMLYVRIYEITGMRALRILPDGHRTLVRAMALLSLLVALLLGGSAAVAGTRFFTPDPLTNIALAYVAFSVLSFLMFARDLRGRAKTIAVSTALGAGALTVVAMSFVPNLWSWLAASACALLWLIALRTRDVPRFSPVDDQEHTDTLTWPARLEVMALLVRAPAATILNAGRGTFGRLADAVIAIVIWAIVIHLIAGHPIRPSSFALSTTLIAGAAAAFMLGQGWGTPARARLLWLLSGESRSGIFRLAERTLMVNLLVLCACAWFAANVLALMRGPPASRIEVPLSLAGICAGCLAPTYFGLLLPTLDRAWQRIVMATLAFVTVALGPAIWLQIVIVDAANGAGFTHAKLLIALVAGCLLLRAIAMWRWKSIDWMTIRSESRVAL